ncbi:hypothetical protein GDO78_001608 [Eleutherodactylus coqui]|uniref:Sugar phosphate phosphatase n=1 Tax=Eleutherodactylus coqui TaxID=57060 RepID=A0A8J6FSI1_ELECQ|nr:hypothetical protein GDO78_001608 [Eleutherodactylus coqui]
MAKDEYDILDVRALALHLKVSLWGNKFDLSISGAQDNSQKTSILPSLEDFKAFLLVGDMNSVWNILSKNKDGNTKSRTRVDMVLDNAGFELVTDLVLADAIISLGLATEVHFHGKVMPWYVSDTTKHNLDWTVQQCLAINNIWMSKCGQTWMENHLFWTLPHEYCTMAEVAPDLYIKLKLTRDQKWDFIVPFSQALRCFHPAPLCSVSTLKADVQVGLQAGVGERLTVTDTGWLISGKYGIIQFSPVV